MKLWNGQASSEQYREGVGHQGRQKREEREKMNEIEVIGWASTERIIKEGRGVRGETEKRRKERR